MSGAKTDKYNHEDGFSSVLTEMSGPQRCFFMANTHCFLCRQILTMNVQWNELSPWLREELTCQSCHVIVRVKEHLIQ